MRAAVVSGPGEVPVAAAFEEPEARDGEQVVPMVAAAIHPLVRGLASGAHYGSSDGWPQIPGVDGVARTEGGGLAYVGFVEAPFGTMAERAPVRLALPLPVGAEPLTIAAGMNPGLSSWLPLTRFLGEAASASVLVLGATGNAGRLAVQNCRALGVPTIVAAARDEAALGALTELGATATSSLTPDDLGAVIAEHQPTLVLDYLWGAVAEHAVAALATRGLATFAHPVTYVEIGAAAGPTAAIPAAALRSRSITLRGSGAGSVPHELLAAAVASYAEVLTAGTVTVEAVGYPLDDLAAAWADSSSAHRAVVVV